MAFQHRIPVFPNPLTPAGKQEIEAGEGDALVMELTDPAHQPFPRAHPYKLFFLAGPAGMYLFIGKGGDRTWRSDYHIGKSRRTAELGHYPETGFDEAKRKSLLQERRVAQGKPVPRINRHSMNGYHVVFLGN